jgi:hypothetical protein
MWSATKSVIYLSALLYGLGNIEFANSLRNTYGVSYHFYSEPLAPAIM